MYIDFNDFQYVIKNNILSNFFLYIQYMLLSFICKKYVISMQFIEKKFNWKSRENNVVFVIY